MMVGFFRYSFHNEIIWNLVLVTVIADLCMIVLQFDVFHLKSVQSGNVRAGVVNVSL